MKLPGSDGEHQAQKTFGTTRRALAFYDKQMLDHVNGPMREFIAGQEFVFIATADSRGECDCSFRTGPAGFVQVWNEKTLIYPEYRGNGVMASIGNILENPHIGVIFIDFLNSTVGLHVNGKARILENEDLQKQSDLPPSILEATEIKGGRKPERWIIIEITEAYIHCSKHIPLLQKLDKKIHWGTDNPNLKGGDYFKAGK